jgi:DNA-directed RNA polymerase specialized sigma24 family protein
MTPIPFFLDLIRRVRAGEQEASTDLVRRFEPEIHKSIRLFLVNFRLHRILDIDDISQAVFATFFARAAAGEFVVSDAEQLLKLLLTMARNKVRDEARKSQAQRRDRRRIQEKITEDCLEVIAGDEPTPSKVVAGHELLAEFYRRLTAEERWLAEQRCQGKDWAAIADELGASVDCLRKKLARACSRVGRQLGLPDMLLC